MKEKLNKKLPKIIDTKYLALNSNVLASRENPFSKLEDCFKESSNFEDSFKFVLGDGFERYKIPETPSKSELEVEEENRVFDMAHEAGYDALMTGVVLLKFAAQIGIFLLIEKNLISKIGHPERV